MSTTVLSKLLKLTTVLAISTILAFTLSARVTAVGSSNSSGNEDSGSSESQQSNASDNGQGGESAEDRQARRQSACQAGQTNMERVRTRLSAAGDSFQNKVNSLLERLDAYVAKKGLTSETMTQLRERVTTEKDGAKSAIETTKKQQGSLNCNDPDSVVQSMNAYKNGVQSFKAEAKEYVASLKAYIQEVKAVALATEESAQ